MFNPALEIFSTWESAVCPPIFADEEGALERSHFQRLAYARATVLAIRPGEPVLISSGRGVRFFIDLMAVWLAGGVIVPYSPSSGEETRCHMQDTTGARLCLDDDYSLETMPIYDFVPASVDESATCAFLFTSGSTGKPKAVELSVLAILGNAYATQAILQMKDERLFLNIPFHFTSAICHFLACALSSSTLLGYEIKLIFSDYVNKLIDLKPTAIGGAPVQFRWLADSLADTLDLFSRLRMIISSGDHLPRSVIEALRATAPRLGIFTVYGLTEVGGRFCILQPEQLGAHLGSVGKPIEGLMLKILAQDSEDELGPHREGEIVISGNYLATGYYRNPDATAKVFTSSGFRTGDLGYLDGEGFLYLKGRSDDVFKVNGAKVSGTLISQALMQTGSLSDAAVVAMDIPPFGTVPVACVTLKANHEFSKGSIRKALRSLLPPNHMPHDILPVKEIPRTGSGKVRKQALLQYANSMLKLHQTFRAT